MPVNPIAVLRRGPCPGVPDGLYLSDTLELTVVADGHGVQLELSPPEALAAGRFLTELAGRCAPEQGVGHADDIAITLGAAVPVGRA